MDPVAASFNGNCRRVFGLEIRHDALALPIAIARGLRALRTANFRRFFLEQLGQGGSAGLCFGVCPFAGQANTARDLSFAGWFRIHGVLDDLWAAIHDLGP